MLAILLFCKVKCLLLIFYILCKMNALRLYIVRLHHVLLPCPLEGEAEIGQQVIADGIVTNSDRVEYVVGNKGKVQKLPVLRPEQHENSSFFIVL